MTTRPTRYISIPAAAEACGVSATTQLAYKQADAAKLLGVSDRTLRNWKRDGVLLPVKVGKVELYPRRVLEAVLGGRIPEKVAAE